MLVSYLREENYIEFPLLVVLKMPVIDSVRTDKRLWYCAFVICIHVSLNLSFGYLQFKKMKPLISDFNIYTYFKTFVFIFIVIIMVYNNLCYFFIFIDIL